MLQEGSKSTFAGLLKKISDLSFEYDIQPSIWRYYQTKGFKKLLKAHIEVHHETAKYIAEAVERSQSELGKNNDEKSVIAKIIEIDENIAETFAEDMFTAGVETISVAMSTLMYCLSKNPEKQEMLRREINKILPDKTENLNSVSFDNAPYLRAVVKETLRLGPVLNGNIRAAGEDLVLQGYQIPKGVSVTRIYF